MCQVLHDQIHLNSRAGPARDVGSVPPITPTRELGFTATQAANGGPGIHIPGCLVVVAVATFPSDEEESEAQPATEPGTSVLCPVLVFLCPLAGPFFLHLPSSTD